MTTDNEARALIISAGIHLRKYKEANSALKATKAELFDYLDGHNLSDFPVEDGSGVRMVERTRRELLLDAMPDELVIWCARNGLLSANVTALDELPDASRQTLKDYIGQGEPSRFVDVYFPNWAQQQQAKKATARAAPTATVAPSLPPVPCSECAAPLGARAASDAREFGGRCVDCRKSQRTASNLRAVRIDGPASNDGAAAPAKPLCPAHGVSSPSKFNGGYYCPRKTDDGEYCKWSTEKKRQRAS